MNDKNPTQQIISATPSLFDRVIASPTARNSIATAAAGVLIATITEVLWPSKS